jgi:hypothetical protein
MDISQFASYCARWVDDLTFIIFQKLGEESIIEELASYGIGKHLKTLSFRDRDRYLPPKFLQNIPRLFPNIEQLHVDLRQELMVAGSSAFRFASLRSLTVSVPEKMETQTIRSLIALATEGLCPALDSVSQSGNARRKAEAMEVWEANPNQSLSVVSVQEYECEESIGIWGSDDKWPMYRIECKRN